MCCILHLLIMKFVFYSFEYLKLNHFINCHLSQQMRSSHNHKVCVYYVWVSKIPSFHQLPSQSTNVVTSHLMVHLMIMNFVFILFWVSKIPSFHQLAPQSTNVVISCCTLHLMILKFVFIPFGSRKPHHFINCHLSQQM